MNDTNIPGIKSETDLSIDWFELGYHLGEDASSSDVIGFLGGLASSLHNNAPDVMLQYIADDLSLLTSEDRGSVIRFLTGVLESAGEERT